MKEAAARAWGVDRSAIVARLGTLTSGTHTGRYAEFATAAAAITLAQEPAIKKPGEWWLLGKPLNCLGAAVPDAIAVVANRWQHATTAFDSLPIRRDTGSEQA